MYNEYKKNVFCRLCMSKNISQVFSIGRSPLGNALYKSLKEKSKPKYPLALILCENCGHLQLSHKVNPRELFQDSYTYLSGTSKVFVDYLESYVVSITNEFNLGQNSKILEIGSNDGTCLSFFKKKTCKVIGVDPAELPAKIANKKGINTIVDFFSSASVDNIIQKFGHFDLVTSHNALAHVDDLIDVFKAIKKVLRPKGMLIFEIGYRLDVLTNFWFDTIYHEHLDYHAVKPLKLCLESLGFHLFRVIRGNQQGGSIRIYCSLDKLIKVEASVKESIELEQSLKLFDHNTYKLYFLQLMNIKKKFKNMILKLKSKNKKIIGFGVPTKLTTLMTTFKINKYDIEYFVDENEFKQNKFTPIDKIPIYSTQKLHNDTPDVIVIFAWNFAESIFKKYSYLKKRGVQFVVPLPYPKVL